MKKYSVSEIDDVVIAADGLPCMVQGKFFYRIAGSHIALCYLAERKDSPVKIELPIAVGELVVAEDESFGMMVGGEFAYYDLECLVEGVLHRENTGGLGFRPVKSIALFRNETSQVFNVT